MTPNLRIYLLTVGLFISGTLAAAPTNVVFVISDDQGYGDLGCTGNPIIKTPHIDQLASESSGLSDYHVAPTCSPTRCSLLTGHWTNRTGVWHTIMGRSMLRENDVTVGQMFADAGYETGMFGKWHLGDPINATSQNWSSEIDESHVQNTLECVERRPCGRSICG